jgi:hypothetical protein
VRLIGADTETFLLAPGVAAPRLVCGSYDDDDFEIGVELADDFMQRFRGWLLDPAAVMIFHHAPFDLGVLCAEDPALLPHVFRALRAGRIRDTKIREQVIENAKGELKFDWDEDLEQFKRSAFTLERVVWNRLKEFVNKGADTWRMRYGLLHNVPIAEWPEDAVKYALKDATLCRRVFVAQEDAAIAEGCALRPDGTADIPGEIATTLTAFCLGLMSIWGVRTDPEMTKVIRAEFQEKYDAVVKIATGHGLVKKGKRKMKPIRARVQKVYQDHGEDVPLSDSGKNISTNRETLTLKRHPSWEKDEGLTAVADVVRYQKLLTTYVPILERGAVVPITPSWNAMVETFRTSCSNPNLQNMPRGSSKHGDDAVRRCFIPRPGWVFVSADYSTLEMRTLGQRMIDLGFSHALAEAFKVGKDPHIIMTAEMLELPYEVVDRRYNEGDKVVEDARQGNKISNYGCGGGMGPDALRDYARGYDQDIDIELARRLHSNYRRTWGTDEYFNNYVSVLCDGGECETFVDPRTGYVRGRIRYTALANWGFQHPAAVGAKAALCQVSEECYTVETSPLFGCRPVIFPHDEIILEVPLDRIGAQRASAAADRLVQVMVEEMSVLCPDVPIEAQAVMMNRWVKGARPVRVDGLLVPSKKVNKVWVPDLERRAA